MGGIESKTFYEVLEHSPIREHSEKYNLNEWDYMPPKNVEYYAGNRMCIIPKQFYKESIKGYFYGYY